MEISKARERSRPDLQVGLGFLLMVLCGPIQGQHQIVLSLEKEQYLVDEGIWFEAIEENLTDQMVISSIFRPAAMQYCEVLLVDSKGNTLPYRGGKDYIPYRPEHWNGFELRPSDRRYLVKALHGIFGSQDEAHDISFYLSPGRYSLQVLLHTRYGWHVEFSELAQQMGPEAALLQVDRKTIWSNVVEFEIVEPQGIEREAHEKLLQAGRLEWEISKDSKVYLDIYQIRSEIATQYPNSVYAINSYAYFLRPSAFKAGHRVDLERQLALFHNRTYIHSLLRGSNVDQLQLMLPDVAAKYPGSKAHSYIQQEIVRMRGTELNIVD